MALLTLGVASALPERLLGAAESLRLRANLVAMESVTREDAGRFVLASFVVESDRPGPVAVPAAD